MRKVIIGLGTATLLVLAGCATGEKKVAGEGTATTTTVDPNEGIADFPDEGVSSTTQPEVAKKKVGDTATLVSTDTNEEVAKVQVTKVKFSGGDEFNQPERATFMGVYVKVKALADDQSSLYATSMC